MSDGSRRYLRIDVGPILSRTPMNGMLDILRSSRLSADHGGNVTIAHQSDGASTGLRRPAGTALPPSRLALRGLT